MKNRYFLYFFIVMLGSGNVTAEVVFDTGTPSVGSWVNVRNDGVYISRASSFNFSSNATVQSVSMYIGSNLSSSGTITYSLFSGSAAPSGSALYSATSSFNLVPTPGWQTINGLNWSLSSGVYTLQVTAGTGVLLNIYNGASQTPDSITSTYEYRNTGPWTQNATAYTLGINMEGVVTSSAPEIDGNFGSKLILLLGGILLIRRSKNKYQRDSLFKA